MDDFQNTSWFETLKTQTVETIYKRGEVFSFQGEPLKTVGLVLSGKANAQAYSVNGDMTWVGEYKEGQFIGLMSLLTNEISRFEVRATSKLTVLVLSFDKIQKLMQSNLALSEAIARGLAVRLDSSVSDIIDLHTLSVRGRICTELIRLAFPMGIDPDRHIIRPSPVFVELAQRLNSSRETVSRTVSELQGKGIVEREPGALIINDHEALQDAIRYI